MFEERARSASIVDRAVAVEMRGQVGGPNAMTLMVEALTDPDERLHLPAARGLAALKSADAAPLLASLAVAAILGYGSLRVLDGELTLGQLVAFQILMISFVTPIERLVNLGGKLQIVEGDMNRLDDVLAHPPVEVDDRAAPLPAVDAPSHLVGAIALRNVSFGYSPLEPPLLAELDLEPDP